MAKPSRRFTGPARALLMAVGPQLAAACVDPTEPDPSQRTRPSAAGAATVASIANNAVYQVRKESGASAYDPATNTTYVTYNGPGMDIYVRAYGNATGTWGPLTLARTWTHNSEGARWSYHNYAAMVLGPDGKLHILQADHAHAMYEIVAPRAHSVSGPWGERLVSADGNAYPSVAVVGNSLYVVYVKDHVGNPDTYRTLRFTKKDWNGSSWSSWSAPRTIIDTRRMMGARPGSGDLYDEVYQQSVTPYDGKLWITFHLAGGAATCAANRYGHNCGAKDLYLAGLDVADPARPGDMYSVSGRALGPSIGCAALGECPEFLRIGTGARVAAFPADPRSSDWGLSHPISFSMSGWSAATGTYFVAYTRARAGDDNTVSLARFAGGVWSHMTVDRGKGLNLRDISMTGGNAIELAYLTGAPVTVKTRKVSYTGGWPAVVGAVYPDFAVPMVGTPAPDRVSFLQIVTTQASSGKPLKLFGTTFNHASRQTDYSGDWNAFGVYHH